MKRIIQGLVMLLTLAVATSALAADTIKIGAIFSVTGPASFLGEPEKNTALMLAEEINKNGGVLGKQIEVIVYDDETNVNKCVMAAQKLLKKDRVSVVIGPTTSGNTLAIMKFFKQAKVPMVSCAASERIVKPIEPMVFKTPQSDRHAVQAILKDAKKRGYKNIAILTVSDGYGQSGRAVLQELIPAQGFTLAADEVYGPKDTDMTAQLTKIKGASPDAIICWGTNPGPAVVARNRVQLGMETPLYMSHGVASKKFIELAGDAAQGIMLPAGHLIVAEKVDDASPQKPVLLDYLARYKAAYSALPSQFGGYAYDALSMVVKAIEMGQSAKPADIRDNLEKITNYVGASGVFNMSAEDHNGLDESAFEMIVIDNGDWKILD